jgi:diguanylate cyclase (GGDEF)-like protein
MMEHFVTTISTMDEVTAFLQQPEVEKETQHARSILLQLFVGHPADGWLESLLNTLQTALPSAVIVGVSSSGEIVAGEVKTGTTAISLLCFNATDLHPVALEIERENEFASGKEISRRLLPLQHLRGVLMLAPPTELDCARLLEGIEETLPGINLFGAGAGAYAESGQALIIGDGKVLESGVVAVGFDGESLRIETDLFFGWEGIGPHMTITETSSDNRIHTIDHQPAFNVYSHYLCLEPGEDLFLLEFPLLLERDGHTLARNPIATDKQGCVSLVADVHSGESTRLGYLDIDTVVDAVRGTFAVMQAFRPDAILLYSCICRHFFLQQETELETLPFQELAPVAGFFTHGEFFRMDTHLQLLNSSQVVVAMREGAGRVHSEDKSLQPDDGKNRFRTRHLRITSRLFRFITALTEELEQANKLLQHKAEHDALTGAWNRHRLETDLQTELSRAKRHDRPLSLVMFDIDYFKRINDGWGHLAGDHVLRTIAQTVWGKLRAHDMIFRYGGEEFLLLLPEINMDGARVVAEKARVAVSQLSIQFRNSRLPQITVSFGVATTPDNGRTGNELLEAVDAALYNAKKNGRNRVEVSTTGAS